ncbi:oligosaccharide flippase family protein [Flagellimonas sp. 389]|uniref:lipopolysaccharide biosynthesis protein n=1 Tax=Flagellimonas sp. 389 TaxID=2835862 RepID=UPI001BD47072|nr:oligosaccharide flippase family protein [Flagellimonas sp. 389]MBS9461270.1 oligosaccharide flippase family protein [Flagellimonas sp. 389]
MKAFLASLWKSPFVKNTSYLISGTAISQLIGILLTPILSRYYSPTDFGIFGSIITLAGILQSFGTLKFEMGIVQADSNKEAERLALISVFFLTSSLIIFFVGILIFPNLIGYLGISSPNTFIVFITVFIALILGYNRVFIQIHNRFKQYYLISKKAVLDRLTTVIFQLAWVFIFATGIGLVYGNIFGGIISLVVLASPFYLHIKELKCSYKKLKSTAKKYYRYALYTAPKNLLNAVSQGLPIIMFGRYFGENEVGRYFFAVRILQLPSALIGEAVKQVFYKEAADFKEDIVTLKKKFFKVTFSLLGIILLPTLIVFLWGDVLFSFFFGDEWEVAGEYASWMFLWLSIGFVNPPASAMYFILNKQREQLFYEIGLFSFRYGALVFGGMRNDILFTVQIYSIIGMIFNIGYIVYISIYLCNRNISRG